MGFSINVQWEKPLADTESAAKFAFWSRDVQYLATYLPAPEHKIPSFFSFDSCFQVHIAENGERYLVQLDPPPRKENWLVIRGLEGMGEPTFTATQVIFNGDAGIGKKHQDFIILLEDLAKAPYQHFCKTGQNPYSNLVICALVRFIHYFPEATIYSDEGEESITRASTFCKRLFGED